MKAIVAILAALAGVAVAAPAERPTGGPPSPPAKREDSEPTAAYEPDPSQPAAKLPWISNWVPSCEIMERSKKKEREEQNS